jgi:3-hydroxyisobutyrate dehydrogenase-like beta-hydroxyacid dehydrogenase
MGAAVAARLAETGAPAAAWTRSGHGSTAQSPRTLAEACDAVLTFVSGEEGDSAVYLGPEGLFAAPPGPLLINHSTHAPRFAISLAEAAAARGHRFIEAPVLGTVAPARAGALVALLGATQAEADAAAPILARYCRAVRRLGPPGAGAGMKIVHNAILSLYWAGVSEAFAFGRAAGLADADMIATVGDSFATIGQWPLKERLLRGEGGEVGFPIAALARELALVAGEYAAYGAESESLSRARMRAEAACAAGWGARDVAELALYTPPTR